MTRLAIALLVATVAGASCGRGNAEPSATPERPPLVLGPSDVARAEVREVSSGVLLTGTLEPSQSASVKAQVAGTIRNLRVDRGDPVRRGQVLAVIESRAVQSEAAGAQVAVSAAEAAVATAARQLEGARTLHEAGALSDIDFQNSQSQYEAAQAQLAAARAQLTASSEQAARTTITAPLTGVVSARMVNEGEAVSVNQELLTVVNPDLLELRGQIPVRQAALVRAGLPVTFTLDAYPGREFMGRVARVDPVADPMTRQVGAALELPNRDRTLIAGQFVTGRVITANVGRALQIPQPAVRIEGSQTYALAIRDGMVERRPIVAGVTDSTSGMVVVMSGLEEGDLVVVAQGQDVQPGVKVALADVPGASPASPAGTEVSPTTGDQGAIPDTSPSIPVAGQGRK